LTGAVDHRYSQ